MTAAQRFLKRHVCVPVSGKKRTADLEGWYDHQLLPVLIDYEGAFRCSNK